MWINPFHVAVRFQLFIRRNPFHATGLFLYPLKTSENLWFSVFSVAIKRDSGMK